MNTKKSKVKVSRQLGIALTPKAERYLEKRAYPPGQHGRRGYGKMSDYKKQLYEKQKLRAQYNISEKQLVNYYKKASKKKGATTAESLIKMLEMRLDAVVLRGGLARTIYQARQLVAHGHILVDGRKLDIPSALVKENQVISVKEKSKKVPCFAVSTEAAHVPEYLSLNPEELTITVNYIPNRDEVPIICEMSQVIEFYSR